MQSPYAHVHLIGIGGIHVSALAKILLSLHVRVSGSDLVENDEVKELRRRGVQVSLGHSAEHIPQNAEAIVFSSAANETNPERIEGARRGLPAFNSHQFLGLLAESMQQIIITGTHGKSTTTAMIGVVVKACHVDPLVVVGTRVPQLADGNVEIPAPDVDLNWLVAEGDEFDRHFLAYHPKVLVINNIEGDHFDIYPTFESMVDVYRQLIKQVVQKGEIIANADDLAVRALLGEMEADLNAREIGVTLVGSSKDANIQILEREFQPGKQIVHVYMKDWHKHLDLALSIPGEMNARNAAMCLGLIEGLALPEGEALASLSAFKGIWRRFEKIGEKDGVTVFSDYGHHPTAVQKTLAAAKEFYPDRRLVLCFQPHHRNRTKHLFSEFTTCFDLADVVILTEIYDVKGREQAVDENISSKDLMQAIQMRAEVQGVHQELVFVETPDEALQAVRSRVQSGDVVIVMGAGDLYKIAYALV